MADPATIHHLAWADNPEWAYGAGLYHIDCDYRLMVDNLMGLTHETYVDASSIGRKEIDEAPVSTKAEGEQVVTSSRMKNIMPPPLWQAACAATACLTTHQSTVGRSAASTRPAT
jgi:vanillate O-demethylase monooxygenase subunit